MENNKHIFQRDIYKLLENITQKEYATEIDMLKSIVKHVVADEDFAINAGRIWELIPEENCYKLKYQHGGVKDIPHDYSISILDIEVSRELEELQRSRTIINEETNPVLKEHGIEHYSLTGVGEIIRLSNKKFYKYALGFNADNFHENFFETLSIISSVSTVSLRNMTTSIEQIKFKKDIAQASEIQRNLLPEHYLKFLDYEVYGICIPDSDVGGDYFDYIQNKDKHDEERVGIVISDAASKGLPAAIQSLFVSGAIRMGMAFSSRISHIFSLLNTLIYQTFPYERFVTLFYCELTKSQNRMVLYSNAGHCAPIHYRTSTDTFKLLGPTGGLLGIVENQKYGLENIRLHRGDILVLYTDGLTEAQNENQELYGEDRIMEIVRNHKNSDSRIIATAIIEDVQKYSAKSTYNDDKTIIVIKRDS